ncbi:MAG: hypothetical protein AB7I27_07045 [Bacteriovoracaceae bacterium]
MKSILFSTILSLFILLNAFSVERELKNNNVPILFPEPLEREVDPAKLRVVDEEWFNQEVYPELYQIVFFSHLKQDWFKIPHSEIYNNCFARRMLIDLFLWGETTFQATIENHSDKIKYLTPFFRTQNFIDVSWIETARIVVVGKLQAGEIKWSNHEVVALNTDQGIRILDPSFSNRLLKSEEWFSYFAPEGRCFKTSTEGLREINQEMVRERMGGSWRPQIPKCGFVFQQRLDAQDIISGTARYFGTPLEKMLSRKLYNYMEYRLIPR